MNDLPDINVWLALIDKRHVHHGATSLYWADASVQSRAFCGTHKSAHGPPQDPAKQRSSVHTYICVCTAPLQRNVSPRWGLSPADLCAFGTMRRAATPTVAGYKCYSFDSCLRTPDVRKWHFDH